MRAPLFDYGFIGDEAGLIVGFLIGLGFGFSLERAGFGSARKLMAQFYLTDMAVLKVITDMAVLKVMFTAVVTAMLGVTYLAWMGWLDVQLVYLVPTFIWPQIVGGLLLGMAVAFPALQGFYESGALGELTLSDVFHVRAGVVVFGVVLMGLGAFQLAAFVERRFAVER